ncbi:hypothetical protein K470DRAFT_280943 [Piedraia hortae CBS 480.64]|uniref:Vacuolar protein sorting-associated protein 62 n=1 Tax=Piedraia hortae CBS 480.64 TaxID=1314780 RepID=A0A6A7C4J9_9PEZI|nr:hypothetical protein K470DRAFT_280943 [Piedraia hortae CBS 480.64]
MRPTTLPLLASVASLTAAVTPPPYVLTYAPIHYLHPDEKFLPSDISTHLLNVIPYKNNTPIPSPNPLTPTNLNTLSGDVYLTSRSDPTLFTSPQNAWEHGSLTAHQSSVIITTHPQSNPTTIDAYYFTFYSLDYGGIYLGHNIGNHVGDWEHVMIRFVNATPTQVWLSQHANGEAFYYNTLEKEGVRPVVYIANGTHANYAVTGTHDHAIPDLNLPAGVVVDHTGKGARFDPTVGGYYAEFDAATGGFSGETVGFLGFRGRWGDRKYEEGFRGQDCPLGITQLCKWTDGPTGPWDKDLKRDTVCPDNGILCIVRWVLGP